MCIYMCFYDKKVYFFHNECADSSKPHLELKLFSSNLVYHNTNTYSILFYEHYKYRNNSLENSVRNKSGLLWFLSYQNKLSATFKGSNTIQIVQLWLYA